MPLLLCFSPKEEHGNLTPSAAFKSHEIKQTGERGTV